MPSSGPSVLEKFRRTVLAGRLVMIRGRVQRAGDVVHLVAGGLEDLTHWLDLLAPDAVSPQPTLDPAGANGGRRLAASRPCHPRNQRVIPGSRDFR